MRLRLGVGSRRPGGHARAGFLLVALAAFAVVLVPSGSASGPSSGIKQAFVCLAQGTLNAASVPGTCDTSALPGGQTVPLTLTIGNANTSTQSLGSANLDVPANSGISILLNSPGYVLGTGEATQTFGTNTATELQLRNLNLPPGQSVSVNFSVSTPCSGASLKWGPLSSGPDEKQSNNFSGVGNDFNNTSGGGFTSGIVAGGNGVPDHLAFSVQPSDGQKATTGSPSAQVKVYDKCGNVTNQGDGNPIALSLVQPADKTFGGSGTLSGTVSKNPTSGVATFSDLQVSASGAYALKASYTGLADVTSNSFNIFDVYGDCSVSCTDGSSDGTTSLQIQVGGGNTGIGFGAAANNQAACSDNGAVQPLGAAFVIVPPAGGANFYAVLTISKRGLQGVGVSNIVVCKNTGGSTPLTQIPKCPSKKTPSPPCIVSETSSNAGDAVITLFLSPTDPGGSGFG